jgi:hypothetical protein
MVQVAALAHSPSLGDMEQLESDDIAAAVVYAVTQPRRVNVNILTLSYAAGLMKSSLSPRTSHVVRRRSEVRRRVVVAHHVAFGRVIGARRKPTPIRLKLLITLIIKVSLISSSSENSAFAAA